jgi:hypothetical protein
MADDITNPQYLLRPALGSRSARILSGRGTFAPGYTKIGEQPGGLQDGIQSVRVLKMVSPLTGQGPASPLATGRYANMNYNVLSPRILRRARAVAPNTGSTVVIRPKTAIRRMDQRGQGVVSYV